MRDGEGNIFEVILAGAFDEQEEACAEAGVETAALRAESGAPEEVR